jgi:hypothetical protein
MCKCANELLVSHATCVFKDPVNVLSSTLTMNSTPHSPHLGEFVRMRLIRQSGQNRCGMRLGTLRTTIDRKVD